MKRHALILSLAIAWAFPSNAGAQPQGTEPVEERIQLSFAAPPECGDKSGFISDVEQRTKAARFVDHAEGVRAFSVTIVRNHAEYDGRLIAIDKNGKRSARSFSHSDCSEVTRSLALVLAVAVDPEAALAPPPPPPPEPDPPREPVAREPQSAKSLPAAQDSRAAKRAAERRPSRATGKPPRETKPRERVPSSERTSFWILAAGAFAQAGVAPEVLIGPAVSFRWAAGTAGSLAGPEAGASVLAGASGVVSPDAPLADYQWLALRAHACPIRVTLGKSTALKPCGLTDLGLLSGAGHDVARPSEKTGIWWSAGAKLGLDWRPAARFVIDLSANVQANLRRDTFLFERPRRVVHEVPPLSFGGLLGAGLEL